MDKAGANKKFLRLPFSSATKSLFVSGEKLIKQKSVNQIAISIPDAEEQRDDEPFLLIKRWRNERKVSRGLFHPTAENKYIIPLLSSFTRTTETETDTSTAYTVDSASFSPAKYSFHFNQPL